MRGARLFSQAPSHNNFNAFTRVAQKSYRDADADADVNTDLLFGQYNADLHIHFTQMIAPHFDLITYT